MCLSRYSFISSLEPQLDSLTSKQTEWPPTRQLYLSILLFAVYTLLSPHCCLQFDLRPDSLTIQPDSYISPACCLQSTPCCLHTVVCSFTSDQTAWPIQPDRYISPACCLHTVVCSSTSDQTAWPIQPDSYISLNYNVSTSPFFTSYFLNRGVE